MTSTLATSFDSLDVLVARDEDSDGAAITITQLVRDFPHVGCLVVVVCSSGSDGKTTRAPWLVRTLDAVQRDAFASTSSDLDPSDQPSLSPPDHDPVHRHFDRRPEEVLRSSVDPEQVRQEVRNQRHAVDRSVCRRCCMRSFGGPSETIESLANLAQLWVYAFAKDAVHANAVTTLLREPE